VYGQISRWLIHDLRNPSQALTLMVELMKDEPAEGEDSPEHTMREAGRHLVTSLELLDRVLRIPSRTSGELRPVSLHDHLEFLAALHHAHRSPVTLDMGAALAAHLPAVSAADDHLEHALVNLLINALESCGDKLGGHIGITAASSDGVMTVAVEDNGPGVAAEVAGRLFEPWVTTRTDRPFAGLGLAVARELMTRMGGTLTYDKEKSPGTRFVMTLKVWR
jgi:two-component system C4-dicarboxylate transport sensor histidine kinase DctB